MAADKEKPDTTNRRMFLGVICFTLVLSHSAVVTEGTTCTIGGFDLTRFKSFNPWQTGHNKTDVAFDISFCDDSIGCSNGITVKGLNQTNNVTLSYGNCTVHHQSNESADGELLAMVTGASCPWINNESLTAIFYFKCGKTLGQPVFLGDFGCSPTFEWESYEFCKDVTKPDHEIPCYVHNNSQIIDLSPLTKLKGGYLVNREKGREYYINVCRDITPDSSTGTSSCPRGSGSCRILQGSGAKFGHPETKLQVVGQEIKMTYTSAETPAGCVNAPVTVVYFRCPERGGSKVPMLLSDFSCNVQIEWWTEYACPQQTLTSETCQLTMESHNVDIDLSPLMKPPHSHYPYHLTARSAEGESYDYYLNVCGPLGITCGANDDHNEAVCQVKSGSNEMGKSLGNFHHMLLRYSDGELTLTYRNGEACHTRFRRNTVINFQCDPNAANNGTGAPEFREEIDCTYVFDWKTRYACVNHPRGSACHVEHDGKIFDLSDLTLEKGHNWQALSSQSGDASYEYYINVCHDVLHVGGAQACPAGAAICRKDSSKSISLGSYTSGLQYDPVTQKIFINYTTTHTSGHECPGTVNSVITFICKPGDLESGPGLVHKSADECVYHFEWFTASACPMTHQRGTDCHVVDTQAGFSFDLSGLTKKTGDGYKVTQGQYDYYINVCSKIGGEHCKDPPHSNAAVCQVKKDGSGEFKTGEPNQNLEYFNGVLNLTYTNGEPYHDAHNTPRKTEIVFVCDMAAGAGHPEFLVEENQIYSFKWMTAYACPAQPIECVARDEHGNQYDLSSLAKSVAGQNWVVLDDSDISNRRKFYINVCRPLAPIYGLASSNGCNLNAAVCETKLSGEKETVMVANLGQAKTGPKLKTARDRYLSLEYTDGAPCPEGGSGARYNTTIHFLCSHGQQSRGPSPPRKVGPCSYEIIWDTSAACALKEADSSSSSSSSNSSATPSCTITDGGYTYNLMSLNKKGDEFYTVQSGGKTFKLNICGAVSSANCDVMDGNPVSVCEVEAQQKTGLTFASTMELKRTDENTIIVSYTGHRDKSTGQMTEVHIELACNTQANDSTAMTFVSQREQTYQFRLETPVSCPFQPLDCVVQDRKGNQYDLSPLAKMTGNYDVPDTRPSHTNLHYLINVCRPINEIAGSTCPGGPIGGCQTGGREPYSLGYPQSKPHVADDGTITLRYVGGSVCHRGTPQQAHRSMRITLYCSHTEGVPQFVGESNTCEYSFTWSTPSACPLQKSEGADCKVSDPLYNFQFDLTPLRKTDSDYAVHGGEYTYLLNVCGPLVSSHEQCSGMGVCQTGSTLSHPVAAGKANSKLLYDTGELSLVYDSGKANCHGKYTRKSIITFVCDHSKPGAGTGPQYLRELEDCTYTFVWPTALACPPHGVVDCTFVDPKTGNHYDLSRLSLSGANYVKPYNDITYIINICRSLVHRKGETCPFNAAACMINSTQTELSKKYQSLGEVTVNPVSMEEGQLVIRYNNGAPCSKGGNMSTMIIFSCPTTPTAEEAGPSSHFVRDFCQHGFVWTTSAACPVGSGGSTPSGNSVQGPCKATNPVSHYEFDLSKLRKTTGSYQVNDRAGHYFYLNVCGAVSSNKCNSNTTGSCQTEINGEQRAFNSGNMNTQLQYLRNGVLMLNYSGGDICHHNNVARTTIINFVCHEGAGDGVPTYVDNSDGCVYYFDWHTELACEEKVLCEVNTGKETFDLTPLIKQSGHHLAVPDLPGSRKDDPRARGTFYINVCRPLNPIFNTLCPAGAASCREVTGHPPQSLGQARSRPVYNTSRHQVTLKYDHGQPCANDTSLNASTLIIFICKKGLSQGVPRLVDVTQSCEYVFEWQTNVVCSDTAVEKETANCSYYDHRTDYLFDLSALKDMQQIDSPQGGKISIQACGSLPSNLSASCQGAAVCLVGSKGGGSASLHDGSYGSATTGQFQMDDERLKLSFSNGQKCAHNLPGENQTASTNILFECDHSAGNGQPESLPHLSCELNFKWRTSLTCPPLIQDCVASSGDTTFDLAILSQTRESWEIIQKDGSRYWINLCQSVHGEALKEKCPPNSAVCRHTKDNQVDMLGDLRSQKLSVDENGTVVIEYSQGTSACSSGRRRSNNPLARSVIRLTCGDTVGFPVLKSSKENLEKCLFEFTWATRAVCKKDSHPKVLTDVNQVIQDPRSGGSIDLRPLLQGGNHNVFDGKYTYIINLEGHLSLDHSNAATGACMTAVICQKLKDDATYYHNLGTYASRHYYLNEDQLEVEYTSTEKCTGKYSHKFVSSIITFSCASDNSQRTDPVFRYRTVDCTYLFTWNTPAACMQAKVEVATGGSIIDNSQKATTARSGGINTTTLATIISIFSVILVVCLMAVYFHRPERRAAAAARLKRIILCRRSTENQIRYSVLAQMEEDPEVDPVGTNPFEEDMENELQNGDTVNVRDYHDDSDDDMLL